MGKRQDKQENNNQNAEKNQQDEKNSQSSKEIVLRVLMHCEGCKSKVAKCLKGVEGIEDVTVDYANQRVVVKGKRANPLKVLERLQKKYSSNAELISPKPKPENKEKKEPQKKEEAQPQAVQMILKILGENESVEANMESSRVTVRGVVDPPKLIEYIKKQLGKHAEIVKQEQGHKQGNNNNNKKDPERENIFQYPPQYSSQHIYPNQTFSDENPFACSIM
ncbi:Heavy metal transport/detoxification superfamily protein [Prunus dulcis]|uniref:Heavy metal transport/detoxification superfamily protein n=1 Tax=Prunus dulcis TaxID=3755 RepID=A0A4Y1QPS8_PRUDU|nr:Heavy metal transport/detoxification superfamily protein [Prunus dulcis]